MKTKVLILLIIAITIISCKVNNQEITEPQINIIAYYVPAENYMPDELPLEKLTHIIFSFTNVINGEMKFRHPEKADSILRLLVAQKDKYPDLKVMVACGGWTAGGFSDMALNDSTRNRFAKSVLEFVEKYQLDGIDMDWEYPGIGDAGIKYRKEDKENFTQTMKCLREYLDKTGRDQTLTFAAAGWKRYYNFIELNKVMKYVDFINIMTYDQITYTSPYTGHHTPQGYTRWKDIEKTPYGEYMKEKVKKSNSQVNNKWQPRSVEHIVDYCLEQGVDPKQIITGAAFYGRSWKGVPPTNNGLYQPVSGPHIGWCAYRKIRDKYESKNGYVRYWDPIAKAPYLYNKIDSIFFTYDDTMSVRLKTEYVIEKNLGGIMFWELGNDTKEPESLLHAIYKSATKNRN